MPDKPLFLHVVHADNLPDPERTGWPVGAAWEAARHHVVVGTRTGGPPPMAWQRWAAAGATVESLQMDRGLGAPLTWCRRALRSAQLSALIGRLAPRLVTAASANVLLLAAAAWRCSLQYRSSAFVATLSGWGRWAPAPDGRWDPGGQLVRRAVAQVARQRRVKMIALNSDHARDLEELGVPDVSIVPGEGLDLDSWPVLDWPAGTPTAAFVGRALHSKGLSDLADAVRLCNRRRSVVRCRVYPLDDPCASDRVQPRRDDGMEWCRPVDDVRKVWRHAHAAVLPARSGEGIPRSLVEAAACGRLLITTAVPGCRDVADTGRAGWLVPPADPEQLSVALSRLESDPRGAKATATAARGHCVQSYGIARIRRLTASVWSQALSLV